MDPQFYEFLQKEITESSFQPSNYAWAEFQDRIEEANSPTDLINAIQTIDLDILHSQGNVVEINGKKVVLYNGDIPFTLQEHALYARGMQYAYSALKLMQWDDLGIDVNTLRNYIKEYTLSMEHIDSSHTPESFAQAQQITMGFIGILSQHIAEERIRKTPPDIPHEAQQAHLDEAYLQAFRDLRKATDLISSIEKKEDIICTYHHDLDTGKIEADISERLTFDDFVPQPITAWYDQNRDQHGLWFERFMSEHGQALLHSSPVCTTRDLPGPANAWNEFTVIFDENGVQESPSTRVAISSPFQIRDHDARVNIAEDSVKAILKPSQLDTVAQRYFTKWGPLLEGTDNVTLPILHQTLVASTFFYGSDRDMIEVKTESDRLIENNYLPQQTREINNTVINFSLLQTNNCVNIWHSIINPRNADIDDSEKLIALANFLITRLHDKTQDPRLTAISEYLSSQQRSFIMIKPFSKRAPNAAQQQAIEQISRLLFNGQMEKSGLSTLQQRELALTLSAAVDLKKINHETHLGHWKRRINNTVKINGISLLAPVTGLISLPVYLGRYLFNTTSRLDGYVRDRHPTTLGAVFLPTVNGYKNQQTFKSAYELILAGNLGMAFGGCKSAYDRAGEVKINQSAMTTVFNATGKLPDFFGSDREYYRYLETVSDKEKAGHQSRVVAANDRIGGRKLWEVLPHHYTQIFSENDRNIAKIMAKFRKVKSPPTGDAKKSSLARYTALAALDHTSSKTERHEEHDLRQERRSAFIVNNLTDELSQPRTGPSPNTSSPTRGGPTTRR